MGKCKLHWSTEFNFFCPAKFNRWTQQYVLCWTHICIQNFFIWKFSKIQRNLNVQTGTSGAHETGRNFPPKCTGVWLSPVFGVRYIHLQSPATVCQITRGPLALKPHFHSHNILMKYFTCSSPNSPRYSGKKIQVGLQKVYFQPHVASHSFVRSQQVLHNILTVRCFVTS